MREEKTVSIYQEAAPSPPFAHVVECCWSAEALHDHTHRVVPDGCTDLLLRISGKRFRFEIVGVMTVALVLRVRRGERFVGLRFRPGMSAAMLPASGSLPDLFRGGEARRLARALASAGSPGECANRLERALGAPRELNRAQEALALLAQRKGAASLEELSEAACASERQFRRQCERLSGVPPKVLARILRFREASRRLEFGRVRNLAQLAMDCGYSDQAHFQREFRRLAGVTPREFVEG